MGRRIHDLASGSGVARAEGPALPEVPDTVVEGVACRIAGRTEGLRGRGSFFTFPRTRVGTPPGPWRKSKETAPSPATRSALLGGCPPRIV